MLAVGPSALTARKAVQTAAPPVLLNVRHPCAPPPRPAPPPPALRQSLESEVSILKRIRHGNIVQLLEVVEVRRPVFLIIVLSLLNTQKDCCVRQ